ncbi:hypothetical protein [Dyadobacter sp. 3J3]|uniref:hypothetical protein n=1 Tax=Dyadobacter sp. 3J3 TaxID=2606600 RepID=UPI00135780BA|nr:hypothetical protein [Dyadobacter sp. 3J3]
MKRLLLFSLIFLCFGCQEKFTPASIIGSASFIIKEFSIPGVSNDNIEISDRSVIIKLPANYQNGDLIKPNIKLNDGFQLLTNLDNGLTFEGTNISITAESKVFGIFTCNIYVVPSEPLILEPESPFYNITIQEYASIAIPVRKLGTINTLSDSGLVAEQPIITLKEKSTGKINTSSTGYIISDSLGKNRVKINFPVTLEAGNYEATVSWRSRKTVINAPLTVKYGKLALDTFGWYATKNDPGFIIKGINIYPENSYEMLIENDFTEPRKIKLLRKNYNALQAEIPSDLDFGNYKSTILVNGKAYESLQPIVTPPYTNFFYKRSIEQPVIGFISQPSSFHSGVCNYYTPVLLIKRSEELVVNVVYPKEWGNSTIILRLTNTKTGISFDLDNLEPSSTVMCSFQFVTRFKIPDAMPDGTYSVTSTVGHKIDGNAIISSEKFGQIITVGN